MKKIIFILLAVITLSVSAQVTTPRFAQSGKYPASKLNDYVSVVDTAGADTASLRPKASKTLVKLAVLDSITLKFASVTNSYFGDEVIVIATNASGASHKLKIAPTNATVSSSGNVTLASGLGAVIKFVFNGVKWIEASRAVQ